MSEERDKLPESSENDDVSLKDKGITCFQDVVGKVIQWVVWTIFIASYALSFFALFLWLKSTASFFFFIEDTDAKNILHGLLISIELLLMVPVPAIIGVVVYQTLSNIADPRNPDLEKSYREVVIAKHILAGFLVTVTGTTLLDYLISERIDITAFICGLVLMIGLNFYIFVSQTPFANDQPR